MIYDTVVIGLGCAGMSAAIYAKRSDLNVLVIERGLPGGLINQTNVVDNYLGMPNAFGPELAKKMYEHFKSYDIPVQKERVLNIEVVDDVKIIHTDKGEYKAMSVIIATGRKNRKLPLADSERFEGKGISYCALCDGNFFKGKDVAVVGAGNSAYEEGLFLARLCRKVYVLIRGTNIRAEEMLQEQINNAENVEVLFNTQVAKLNGDKKLESIDLNTGRNIEVNGLFVYIGFEASTDFVKDLNITNEYGYINVNEHMETEIKGIFAAGDIVNKRVYQIVTAVSDGAICGINVERYKVKKN